MIKDLKYFDGQLSEINRVPDDLKICIKRALR